MTPAHGGPPPPSTPPSWRTTLLRWALRTPALQRILGRTTALLTYRDPISDRITTIPVAYARDGHRIIVTDHVARPWWRGLAADPDVHVRLAGQQHHGRARVLRGLAALDAYLTYLRSRPAVARALGIDARTPDHARLRQALRATGVVTIELEPDLALPIEINDRG